MGIPISEEAKDGQGVELGTVSRDSARAGTRVLAGVSGRSWQEAVAGPGRQQVAPGWAVSHQGTDCFLIWALLFFTTVRVTPSRCISVSLPLLKALVPKLGQD